MTAKPVRINVLNPSDRYPHGTSAEGWYDIEPGYVILLSANGDELVVGEWKREIGDDDECAAAQKLLRSWHNRPRPKANALSGPVIVPPHGGY